MTKESLIEKIDQSETLLSNVILTKAGKKLTNEEKAEMLVDIMMTLKEAKRYLHGEL